jgi:hypothetical protein
MSICTAFFAQVHVSYGKARDAIYHGQHTMQSIFYIQDEMYNKPHWWQGLLTTFTVPGIDRILF